MKSLLKQLIPPILINYSGSSNAKDSSSEAWQGNYKTWDEALNNCLGYDNTNILISCKKSLLQVKNGTAVYERDSVIFDEIQYAWPVLAALQKCSMENGGSLDVLDFGGSLGSTYYQNKEFLSSVNPLQWSIVEQEHFVDCGRKYFEDEQLKFYYTIEEVMAKHHPHVLILSSVLQYLEHPFEWIKKFIDLNIPNILIDRTGFISSGDSVLTIQNVPEEIYKASYPCWFFDKNAFINAFLPSYNVFAEFKDSFTPPIKMKQNQYFWKGFYLKRKNDK